MSPDIMFKVREEGAKKRVGLSAESTETVRIQLQQSAMEVSSSRGNHSIPATFWAAKKKNVCDQITLDHQAFRFL